MKIENGKRYRGTIIMDKAAFTFLACPVKPEHKAEPRADVTPIKFYREALSFLENQGYQILIPELMDDYPNAEKAIIAHIDERQLQGRDDIFVLSDNVPMLNHITQIRNVPVMDCHAFVRTLNANGFWQALGLKEGLNVHDIMKDLRQHIVQETHCNYEEHRNWVDRKGLRVDPGHKEHIFADAMSKMVADMGMQKGWAAGIHHQGGKAEGRAC